MYYNKVKEVDVIKVLFVCLGNICRSPMAQIIFENIIKELGIESNFEVDSAGTEGYNEMCHAGIHRGTKEILRKKGIPFIEHYSRKVRKHDYNYNTQFRQSQAFFHCNGEKLSLPPNLSP